jgi:hypothetical protein
VNQSFQELPEFEPSKLDSKGSLLALFGLSEWLWLLHDTFQHRSAKGPVDNAVHI